MRKTRYIWHAVAFLLAALAMTSCLRDEAGEMLQRAEALADSLPEQALLTLDSLTERVPTLRYSHRARYHVTRQLARHKLWQPIQLDSTFMDAVAYTDEHGTSNQRLLAYYLLGYAHAERQQVEKAQRAYLRAIEAADTTSRRCDFSRLAKVYLQKATLELNMTDSLSQWGDLGTALRCAQRAKDAKVIADVYGLMALRYNRAGDPHEALNLYKKGYDICLQYGDTLWGSSAAHCIALCYITYFNELDSAKKYLQISEEYFIRPDSAANILKIPDYFHVKGRYYEKTHDTDLALIYYRKLLSQKPLPLKVQACARLSNLYKSLGQTDSAYRYSVLYINYSDSLKQQASSLRLQRKQVEFDYKKVSVQANKQVRRAHIALAIAIIGTACCIFIIFYFRKKLKVLQRRLVADMPRLLPKPKSAKRQKRASRKKLKEEAYQQCMVQIEAFYKTGLHTRIKQSIANGGRMPVHLQDELIDYFEKHFPAHDALLKEKGANKENILVCIRNYSGRC